MDVSMADVSGSPGGGVAALPAGTVEQSAASPAHGISRVVEGSPRVDASGLNQLCERCGRRLSKVKHHRAYGPGRACHPQCKGMKHPRDAVGQEEGSRAASPAKKPRRTQSAPVLTHEQLLALRSTAKESGTGVQGHSRSPTENAVALLTVHTLTQELDLSYDAAVKLVAASFDHSDYHDTMDGEMFTLWMKNRLLPAFHQLYPGKKMILVMDNATYHRPRDFDWITPYKMCKTACVAFLEKHGVTEFRAEREGVEVTFKQTEFHRRASKNNAAPTVKELQKAVKAYLQQHPGINKTKIDKLLQPLGHSIVWTPPFVPEVQPIELIWAYVKQLVASQYSLNRTIEVTRKQTDDAFDTITPEMIRKRIGHCHQWINDFLKTDDAGSLKAFSTLDHLIAADPAIPQPTDIENTLVEEYEEDEEVAEDSE